MVRGGHRPRAAGVATDDPHVAGRRGPGTIGTGALGSSRHPRTPGPSYAYLLGLYLGDGWIAAVRTGSYVLRLSLDQRYPEIVESAARAMEAVRPQGRSRTHARVGCSVVSCYWKYWPIVLLQHGAGPKHARKITLTDWQAEITAAHPRELVRGLIHSDGCRFPREDLPVRAVLVLEPLGGHQVDLLRAPRPARRRVDQAERGQHRRRSEERRGQAGRVRGNEAMRDSLATLV